MSNFECSISDLEVFIARWLVLLSELEFIELSNYQNAQQIQKIPIIP
jgi:hypothetical protein